MSSRAEEVVMRAWRAGWAPDPTDTVSEWADKFRILSAKASSEPGAWRTSRTPYLREIMDHLSPTSSVRRIIVMKGAQIGFTEAGSNWIGYIIDRDPAPTLLVEPTVDVARRVSKQRIAPMIDSTPALSGRVAEPRSRDSGNTVFAKEFQGGILMLTGANSAAGLRSMPISKLFLDEVDAYPGDVDGEGDPVSLAEERTSTFARRKVLMGSTPTIKGLSRIEKEFETTDKRRYFLPCPACGNMDWLRWENIRWIENDPKSAALSCIACGVLVEERHKTTMLAAGEWRPTAPGDGKTVGYHLPGLLSPLGWRSWAECVQKFLESKDDAFKLKTWVNTVLGETWEERGTSVEPEALISRVERYPAEVPAGVGILLAAVDVQDDRLEVFVIGYGAGEESWRIAHTQLHGDPGHEGLWYELDRFLKQHWTHESGQKLAIECTVVDSGGHHTDQVYRFCKARERRRVFAIRGGNAQGAEIVAKPSMSNRYRVKLFTLCVDTAKDMLYSRLRIGRPGPGYMHLPEWVDSEYIAQLTAEKAIRKYVRGRGSVRQWIKTRERNEALDGEVYALAALYILGPVLIRNLPQRAARFAAPVAAPLAARPDEPETLEALAAAARPAQRPARRSGWVNSWKR